MFPTTTIRQSRTCRHCGGVIKFEGEFPCCLMCGREIEHDCSSCLTRTKKKSERKSKLKFRKVA